MKHTTDNFQTADGLSIHTESWLPTGEPKAVVLMVHGYAEHIGRYGHVAEHLMVQGYAFYGLDHRGHGRSAGERVYFNSFDEPVNDLKLYFDKVRAAHPGKKIFMYGHSMGSLIGLEFALRYQQSLAGLIISGTAVNADEAVPGALLAVSNLLNKVIPKNRMVAPLPSAALSHDPAVVTAYDSDPLNDRGSWRVRTGTLLIQAGKSIRERAGALRLPLLIMHGGEDKVTPLSGSHTINEKAGSADKTLKVYDSLFHEIHNEPEKDKVLADITNWLNARA